MLKPPSQEEYCSAELEVLVSHAPRVFPCDQCHWPVCDGYQCVYCGNESPQE